MSCDCSLKPNSLLFSNIFLPLECSQDFYSTYKKVLNHKIPLPYFSFLLDDMAKASICTTYMLAKNFSDNSLALGNSAKIHL